MNEHKIRQKIYHRTQPFTDSIHDIARVEDIQISAKSYEEIIEDVERHFKEDVHTLCYPAKSFTVAIVYATLVQKYFGTDFYTNLSDPDLLFGNDPFFIPLTEKTQDVYERIVSLTYPVLIHVCNESLHLLPTQIQSTIGYFRKEFFIGRQLDEVLTEISEKI